MTFVVVVMAHKLKKIAEPVGYISCAAGATNYKLAIIKKKSIENFVMTCNICIFVRK
jgi:hypothetical protein